MVKYKIDSISTDKWVMDYATLGHGEKPFVLLPGLSLHAVTPMAQTVAMQYSAFHEDYTIYLFDRRRDVPQGYTLEQMAEDTVQAINLLSLNDICMMGCSQGGMMAQLIAARHPGLVSRLVLCNTASHPSPMSEQVIGRWIELAQNGDVVTLNRDIFAHVYSQAYYERYAHAFAVAEKLGSEDELRQFVRLACACRDYDARPELEHIKCPTLVVGSSIDNVLGSESAVELAQALQCQLIMYDEYGHASFDEAPDLHGRLLEFFGK